MFRTIINRIKSVFRSTEATSSSDTISKEDQLDYLHKEVDGISAKLGYDSTSDTVTKARLRVEGHVKSSSKKYLGHNEIVDWFDASSGTHVRAIVNERSRGVMVKVRADYDGNELIQRVVSNWVGTLDHITSAVVGPHETYFRDANGETVVGFFAAGRKIDQTSGHRINNAQKALQLLGIDASFDEIALADMRHIYEPLVFELKPDGSWTTHELEAIRA